jgi:hypothetical protein
MPLKVVWTYSVVEEEEEETIKQLSPRQECAPTACSPVN